MMKQMSILLVLLLMVCLLNAVEEIVLVESPTAGILHRGEAAMYAKIFSPNGVITGAKVGLFEGFMFGVSFGAEDLVGNQNPAWQDKVEFNAKFRILDETIKAPAWVIGFDSQGHGKYDKETERYMIKSKGFYTTVSKNYSFLGTLGLHAGVNYSIEGKIRDKDLDMFLGMNKNIGKRINFAGEYDFAINDNNDMQLAGNGKGYLNTSIALNLSEELAIKLELRDMLKNRPEAQNMDRALLLDYHFHF